MRRLLLCTVAVIIICGFPSAFAQDTAKPTPLSPIARLRVAKKAFLRQGPGSEFPYKLFESSLTGWGRFTLIDSLENADIIIEISAPYDDSGITVGSNASRTSPLGGSTEQPIRSSRQFSVLRINLTVYDPHSNVHLWFASERPKSAMKQKVREDNIVEATEQLFSKFRDTVEPPPAQ